MKVHELVSALLQFDHDLDVTIAGGDFVVIRERTGGWEGHTPNRLTRWIEINPPEQEADHKTLSHYKDKFAK